MTANTTSVFSGWDQRLPDTLAQAHRGRPSRPQIIDNFIRPDFARDLAAELRTATSWQRQRWLWNERGGVDLCPDEVVFRQAEPRRRFSDNDALTDHTVARDPHLVLARELLRYAAAPKFVAMLSDVVGESLRPAPSCEFAKYCEVGDFLDWHSDVFDGRVLAIVVYLSDPSWRPEWGGRLLYRAEDGWSVAVSPVLGRAVVFPLLKTAQHAAEPLKAAGVQRYSAALHYFRTRRA